MSWNTQGACKKYWEICCTLFQHSVSGVLKSQVWELMGRYCIYAVFSCRKIKSSSVTIVLKISTKNLSYSRPEAMFGISYSVEGTLALFGMRNQRNKACLTYSSALSHTICLLSLFLKCHEQSCRNGATFRSTDICI